MHKYYVIFNGIGCTFIYEFMFFVMIREAGRAIEWKSVTKTLKLKPVIKYESNWSHENEHYDRNVIIV